MAFDLGRMLRSAATDDSRQAMTVPHLRDCSNWRKNDEVRALCRRCAEQLSTHLYRWPKEWPSLSTIKTWNRQEKRFLGMDLSLFQEFIMDHFSIRTADNREWLLDRKIAALIWAECISQDSPLPPAGWKIELDKKRTAKV